MISEKNENFSVGNYYPALDGLRGLAVLLIILYHNFSFLAISRPAWIGVDLFFVLSGFLITGILLKKRGSEHFLRNFYARRILRIFPIYYLGLLIFLFILPRFITYPFSLRYFIGNQSWFWLEIQNWLFILNPQGNNNFLNHFWSLALEEQFYLLSPWIILLIKPLQKIVRFLLTMLLLVFAVRLLVWFIHFDNISYIELYAFTRVDSLCVGSLLAIFRFQGNYRIEKFNGLLFSFFLILIFVMLPAFKVFSHHKLPYLASCFYPGIALFWGWIVSLCVNPASFMYRIFNTRVLIFFGKISYGLYIFHWPINMLYNSLFFTNARNSNIGLALLQASVPTTIAVVVSVISYYTYERYFLGFKKHFI